MADMLLTIQHNGNVFSPPIKEGVQIDWERTGTPGKLTFTTLAVGNGEFAEGDAVCFYCDDKPVFMGYVFTKKLTRDKTIEVTCYDQMRYLKNKFTYVFEKKTATQIIQALCKDFNLTVGDMDDTKYVIPAVAEENKSALDIVLTVLEETLLNSGEQFVLYDDFGKLRVQNVTNMVSTTLICEDTAENFDYKSSIDDETYNQIVLYYKKDDKIAQLYTTYSPSTTKQWGTLRYFEEVKTPTIGQNKADALLKLYNRKTREFKITGAFGDISVRGGTLIPVVMDLGDISVKNYMLVEKVSHKFDNGNHTMDLTLEGAWEDTKYDGVSQTVGELTSVGTGGTGRYSNKVKVTIEQDGRAYRNTITVSYYYNGEKRTETTSSDKTIMCDKNKLCTVTANHYKWKTIDSTHKAKYTYRVKMSPLKGSWNMVGNYSAAIYPAQASSVLVCWSGYDFTITRQMKPGQS